jgi:hypothetical protein
MHEYNVVDNSTPVSSPDFDKSTPPIFSSPDFDKSTPPSTPIFSSPDFDKSTPPIFSSPDFDKSTPPSTPVSSLNPLIYSLYYGKNVELYGEENCGKYRKSIQNYPIDVKKYVSKLCDVIPLENIKFILGPISYTEYDYNGMTISIFGEFHAIGGSSDCIIDNPKNTILVYDFLDSVINSHPDTFYDVFLEIRRDMLPPNATSGVEPTYLNYWKITSSNSIFMKCISNHENCPYENARIHYTDLRDDGIIPPSDNLQKFIKEVYENNSKIMKEIRKSYLGDLIIKYIEILIVSYDDSTQLSHSDRVLMATTTIMDMYLLSRVFKVFAPSTSGKSKPEDIKNAIIYVGELHAGHYRDFIELVLGLTPNIKYLTKTYMADDERDSCLDVTVFKHNSKLFQ